MIIGDNRETTAQFTCILRDKFTRYNPNIYLKITKSDNLAFIYYSLVDISPSDAYSTFEFATLDLDQGQYRAEIFEGIPLDSENCDINEPTVIVLSTWYDCDPATLTATLRAEEDTVFGDIASIDNELIWATYLRIDGPIYNTVYTTEEEYTTYNE